MTKDEALQVAGWINNELAVDGAGGGPGGVPGASGRKAGLPKAASKMVVAELRQELAGQGLPTEGNRAVLYARVQRARRLNKALGKPLWMMQDKAPEAEVRPPLLPDSRVQQ